LNNTAWVQSATLVFHAHWSSGGLPASSADAAPGSSSPGLCLWAESARRWEACSAGAGAASKADEPTPANSVPAGAASEHPFAASCDELRAAISAVLPDAGASLPLEDARWSVLLPESPGASHAPALSPHLAHAVGHLADESEGDLAPGLRAFNVPVVRVPAHLAERVLNALEEAAGPGEDSDLGGVTGERAITPGAVVLGESVRFFADAARFVRSLLAQQRFVPMVMQEAGGSIRAQWQLWLADEATTKRLGLLCAAMPPLARAGVDAFRHDGWAMLESCLHTLADTFARAVFTRENMAEAIEGRDSAADAHVAWLSGLLAPPASIDVPLQTRTGLIKGSRQWIGLLDDRSAGSAWRLMLRLSEPLDLGAALDSGVPGDNVRWTVTLLLQNVNKPSIRLDASDLWSLPGGGASAANVEGERIDAPGEVLIAELSRAARIWKKLEPLLSDPEPRELDLATSDAYRFLREIKPLLIEQGFTVEAPAWWDQPSIRLGARMIVESENVDLTSWAEGRATPGGATTSTIGLHSLVSYRWQIAVGDTTLTLEQFERLASQHAPLVRLNGKWVEIRPEDVKAAMRFIRENPGGSMEVGKALRLAYASDPEQTGLPILGMEATGWVAAVFGDASTNLSLPQISTPRGFVGALRPYQLKGLSWLAFLDRFGLGACLADDMGLGKTIQLLALLAHEAQMRQDVIASGAQLPQGEGPTLLIVPMSVVPNWLHEARRFTPELRVLVHHGPERLTGERLLNKAIASDVVVTTYALAHRDRDDLAKVPWGRVVLDEAQNIKNPVAKQTRAIRSIDARRKIALTGTPVENRLGELWSIMDFLNEGYLGTTGDFRRRFSLPIERYHDRHKSAQLRGLVQPFVLRRLKSDPAVISDLPEKVESKEFCYLSPEQATLYQTCVSDMLSAADKSQGIQRRGLVLAGLIKLKQICNHPALYLKQFSATSSRLILPEDDEPAPMDGSGEDSGAPSPAPFGAQALAVSRSGKCQRLVEMLREIVDAGDKALVFTQFRQMGFILAAILRKAIDREVLFLHGGTPTGERQRLIQHFQGEGAGAAPRSRADAPIFILSLKAGGVGLNLTAANHVFHFDRWWNPAVEAQATDRAYRIGQTRTVQVHKFITAGTLEERIDQMIEAKMELAAEVIGSGEDWLTELSTNQLRDLLTLRADAITDEAEELDEAQSAAGAGQEALP
jgi:hypothetical protein